MKNRYFKILFLSLCSILSLGCFAQGPTGGGDPGDPGFSINVSQNLGFGAFSAGAGGGTVTISNSGSRSATGSVTLLNMGISYFNAIFDIQAPPGTIITVVNGSNVTLNGSNGGTLTLALGSSTPASPFTTTAIPPATTSVSVGGTLTVGSTPTPGTYSGTFSVTFNYQ